MCVVGGWVTWVGWDDDRMKWSGWDGGWMGWDGWDGEWWWLASLPVLQPAILLLILTSVVTSRF